MTSDQLPLHIEKPQPLRDAVYRALTEMMRTRAVSPGAVLNVDAVARVLDVSPTPVREAMTRLEAEGLIVKDPHRSYRVAAVVSDFELLSLMEFRLVVEPQAAAAAASRLAGQEDARRLSRLAREIRGSRPDEVGGVDATAFHDRVAQLSGNLWLSRCVERLGAHLRVRAPMPFPDSDPAARGEHEAIARAIASGDSERAAEAMRTHLLGLANRLRGPDESG